MRDPCVTCGIFGTCGTISTVSKDTECLRNIDETIAGDTLIFVTGQKPVLMEFADAEKCLRVTSGCQRLREIQ